MANRYLVHALIDLVAIANLYAAVPGGKIALVLRCLEHITWRPKISRPAGNKEAAA